MGGGDTKIQETPKRLSRRPYGGEGGEGGAGGIDLATSLCEREQTVQVELAEEVRIGTAVRVVLADPPALIAGGRTVARVAERRAAATLVGCLTAGYTITGEIVAVDAEQATAVVAGVRGQ